MPSWNLTPWRILNVQTSAVEFDDQLVASTGFSDRVWSDRHRYSPVCASMSSPPWSSTVTGLIAPAGVSMPALITAPAAPAGAEDEAPVVADEPDEPLLPQAARIEPRTGADMPTTVARRMKSRRVSRPAANSSMTWLAISPWPWRMRPSCRWLIFLLTFPPRWGGFISLQTSQFGKGDMAADLVAGLAVDQRRLRRFAYAGR